MKIRVITLSLFVIGSFNGVRAASLPAKKLAADAAAMTLQESALPLYVQRIKDKFENRLVIASDLSDAQKKEAEDKKVELLKDFHTAFIDAQQKAEKFDDLPRKEKSIKRNLELYTSPTRSYVSDFRKKYGPEDAFDRKMRLEEEAQEARIVADQKTMLAPAILENHAGLENVRQRYSSDHLPNKAMAYFKNKMRELDSYQKFGDLTEEVVNRIVIELNFYLDSEGWKNDFSW